MASTQGIKLLEMCIDDYIGYNQKWAIEILTILEIPRYNYLYEPHLNFFLFKLMIPNWAVKIKRIVMGEREIEKEWEWKREMGKEGERYRE